MTCGRDALTKAKHDRDNLRSENQKLRGEAGQAELGKCHRDAPAGLIGNNELLRDFDRRKKEIVSMQVRTAGGSGGEGEGGSSEADDDAGSSGTAKGETSNSARTNLDHQSKEEVTTSFPALPDPPAAS